MMQSFGHKTVISSQSKLHIQSKTSLTKVVTFDIRIKICNKKTKLCSHLVTKQSFRHNLNYTFNQKTSLTKVVTFDIQVKNMQ